ncbi:hypothetical protein K474DRAFT_1706455 [Panus rudis PR-1116 ss-1]|nr:hypothetical protein K474DRAFT_1706455 [Panus rudis PR-1116 ss-1]
MTVRGSISNGTILNVTLDSEAPFIAQLPSSTAKTNNDDCPTLLDIGTSNGTHTMKVAISPSSPTSAPTSTRNGSTTTISLITNPTTSPYFVNVLQAAYYYESPSPAPLPTITASANSSSHSPNTISVAFIVIGCIIGSAIVGFMVRALMRRLRQHPAHPIRSSVAPPLLSADDEDSEMGEHRTLMTLSYGRFDHVASDRALLSGYSESSQSGQSAMHSSTHRSEPSTRRGYIPLSTFTTPETRQLAVDTSVSPPPPNYSPDGLDPPPYADVAQTR